MSVRRPGRLLAPLALVLVLIAMVSIVRSTTDSDDTSAPVTPSATTTSEGTRTTATRRRPRRYTVRAGDTLGAIAERTGVEVDRLLQLNPDVEAGALQTGQRLRLTG